MAKRMTTKKLDAMIDRIYRENCSGIVIPMLSIPKIFKAGRDAWNNTESEEAVKNAVLMTVETVRDR